MLLAFGLLICHAIDVAQTKSKVQAEIAQSIFFILHLLLVAKAGLEPARPYGHRLLLLVV